MDTGFGTALNIARTVRELEKIGVAGIHIEDQVMAKRCGHRPGKVRFVWREETSDFAFWNEKFGFLTLGCQQIVELEEMVDRIKAAVSARRDDSFVVMARTDAYDSEGIEGVVKRALAYKEAGADMLFPEALVTLQEFKEVVERVNMPVLANLTEFGRTPNFSRAQLAEVGVALALYPLSAFRAMSLAAMTVYETIMHDGTQKAAIEKMHTRQQVYDVLDYERYEQHMDALFKREDDKKEGK